MARYKESDCVSCERCFNCGRRNGYIVYECDECFAETTNEDEIITVDGKDYCISCFSELFEDDEDE